MIETREELVVLVASLRTQLNLALHEAKECLELATTTQRHNKELLAAILEHHSQKADDRCIEDDDKLYAAAGLPPCDRRVGSKFEMAQNCMRFIERRCQEGGWATYKELEDMIERFISWEPNVPYVQLVEEAAQLLDRGHNATTT